MPSNLELALAYAAEGFRVFPLRSAAGDDDAARAERKKPAISKWQVLATTDPVILSEWWRRSPDAGIGCATGGPQRLVVIDADTVEGVVNLVALNARYGTLIGQVQTHRGYHVYATYPEGVILPNTASALAPHVDTRGEGGYVCLPSNANDSVWISQGPPGPLPDAWVAALTGLKAKAPPTPSVAPGGNQGPSGAIPKDKKATPYAQKALTNEAAKVRSAPVGTRNQVLNNAALGLGHLVAGGQIGEADARIALTDAATAVGLEESEIAKTLTSGLEAGKREPKFPAEVIPMKPAGPRAQAQAARKTEPARKLEPGEEWTRALATDQHGHVKACAANATEILCESPIWHGALAWDEFSLRALWRRVPFPDIAGAPVVGDALTDVHVIWVQRALQRTVGPSFGKDILWSSLLCAAWGHREHVVRDWLHALAWDGTPRVGWWLSTYLGVESTEYSRGVGQKFLISAVARLERPGAQCDHMLVLEGRQRCGKSTTVRILAGDTYLGSLPDVRDRKGAAEVLQGRWICEVGELDALRGAASARVKDFLSQTTDYFRPAYMRVAAEYPRQVVFVGTTNEHQYLSDPTGARRYWPVRCQQLDRAKLAADRDQLWAETLHLYQQGMPWWGDDADEALASAEQEERFSVDEWETPIARWLADNGDEVTTGRILESALRIEPEAWDRASQIRVGAILTRMGYQVIRPRRDDGTRPRIYVRP